MWTYHVLRGPMGGRWRTPMYTKRVLALVIGLMIAYFMLLEESTHHKGIKEIYDLQAKMTNLIDAELRHMLRHTHVEEDDTWVEVNGLSGHIFSAYYDNRPETVFEYSYHSTYRIVWASIFIIAILPIDIRKQDLRCVLKYERSNKLISVPGRVRPMQEHWNLHYSAFFVTCDLTYPRFDFRLMYDIKHLPESIGLKLRNPQNHDDLSGQQFIDIYFPQYDTSRFLRTPANSMALCVPVLHHKFDRTVELIEFIEYYRMMGINHFTFYNSSVSWDVNQVLNHYQMRLIATVLNWTLPSIYVYEQNLRQDGIFAALNDCLYRNSIYKKYKYVGTFDVDEFLIPKSHDNFHDLMSFLDSTDSESISNAAAFIFRHFYFYTAYEDETKGEKQLEPYLYTREKIRRLAEANEAHKKSRYFVRGQDVIEIGHYQVWEFRPGSFKHNPHEFREFIIDPELAAVHHYTPCEAEETACYLQRTDIDRTAQKFSVALGERVAMTCIELFGDKGCPPPVRREYA